MWPQTARSGFKTEMGVAKVPSEVSSLGESPEGPSEAITRYSGELQSTGMRAEGHKAFGDCEEAASRYFKSKLVAMAS